MRMLRDTVPVRHLVLAACSVVLLASDRPKPKLYQDRARVARQDHAIPEHSIRLPLPNVAQPDDYSCGAAALWSVCAYYGVVGPPEGKDFPAKFEEFKK